MEELQNGLNISSTAITLGGLCGGLIVLIDYMAKRVPDMEWTKNAMGKIALFLIVPFICAIFTSIVGTVSFCFAKTSFIISCIILILISTFFAIYFPYISKRGKPSFVEDHSEL